MRIRNLLIAVAVLSLAIPSFASAAGNSAFKVTGGGQTVPSEDYRGPGDTFGFTARATGTDGTAVGQFNHIDRAVTAPGDGARGQGEHIKGTVECIEPTGPNSAQFGGRLNDDDDDASNDTFFLVDVQDNGQEGTDLIYYREVEPEEGDTPCDEDTDNGDNRLSRGNLQIHNAPS